jgi:hypothetical protein
MGTQSFKIIKQLWFEYMCAAQIDLKVYVSGGVLFWDTQLPIHARRDVERMFPPDMNNGVYNKSKLYRFVLSSVSPFKFYNQGCRVESLDISGDQRSGYRQFPLSEATSTQA